MWYGVQNMSKYDIDIKEQPLKKLNNLYFDNWTIADKMLIENFMIHIFLII